MRPCAKSIVAESVKTVGIALSGLLCACTADGPAFQPATTQAADQALVYVYRPDTFFYSANPDVPFLYLDGNQLLRLRIGGYTWLEVDQGPHTISIRDSLLGFPIDTLEEIQLEAVSGETYYVRFFQDYDGMAFVGPTAYAMTETMMMIVPEKLGRQEIADTNYIAIE